jgi:hypothetical protein
MVRVVHRRLEHCRFPPHHIHTTERLPARFSFGVPLTTGASTILVWRPTHHGILCVGVYKYRNLKFIFHTKKSTPKKARMVNVAIVSFVNDRNQRVYEGMTKEMFVSFGPGNHLHTPENHPLGAQISVDCADCESMPLSWFLYDGGRVFSSYRRVGGRDTQGGGGGGGAGSEGLIFDTYQKSVKATTHGERSFRFLCQRQESAGLPSRRYLSPLGFFNFQPKIGGELN